MSAIFQMGTGTTCDSFLSRSGRKELTGCIVKLYETQIMPHDSDSLGYYGSHTVTCSKVLNGIAYSYVVTYMSLLFAYAFGSSCKRPSNICSWKGRATRI